MTGRYAVRTGNASVPIDTPVYGLTQWEYTLPKMLSDVGYATGAFGKWHLGHTEGRFPTDMGFDEWYGIPNSTDEAFWPESPYYRPDSDPFARPEYLMESTKGKTPKKLKVYDLAHRPVMDRELTDKAKDFITRQAKAGKPFFAFIPYTMVHIPILPSPEFDGKTKNGAWADSLAQLDFYTGEFLDLFDKLGITDNTIFIFTSDNGGVLRNGANNGPWRGEKGQVYEGGLRVPFVARHPGLIPAGVQPNGIGSFLDLMPTLARLTGSPTPVPRSDGVDIWPLFTGEAVEVERDPLLYFDGLNLQCARSGRWKLHLTRYNCYPWVPDPPGGKLNLPLPRPELYDLENDPEESSDVAEDNPDVVAQIRSRVEEMLLAFPDDVRSAWRGTMSLPVEDTESGALPVLRR